MKKIDPRKPADKLLVPAEVIERRIFLIRGQKVMLDSHLAELYQVPTKVFNQAVKRNLDRFPEDFMFRLTSEESNRSQFVTGSQKHRDPRYLPYAFSEHGVAMLSSVLNSQRAIHVNIAIMRAFGQLREMLAGSKDFAHKLDQLEKQLTDHDRKFAAVFTELRRLIETPLPPKRRIGFEPPE